MSGVLHSTVQGLGRDGEERRRVRCQWQGEDGMARFAKCFGKITVHAMLDVLVVREVDAARRRGAH